MSDSDDDYMSETLLGGIPDVRPGIARSHAHRRALGICERSESAAEAMKARPKKVNIEKERLEEGLSKPIGEESKGFALLSKMGFKPGMTLGKPKEGCKFLKYLILMFHLIYILLVETRSAPLELNIKLNRTGIGHAAQEKEEQQIRIEGHIQKMKETVAKQEELLVDYRKRKRATVDVKQISGDMWKMRKACEQLDVQNGLESPTASWYWPIYKDKTGTLHKEPSSSKIRRRFHPDEEEDDEDQKYVYSNGKEAPPEVKAEDLDDDDLTDRLNSLVEYLRITHHYCHWCGAKYDSVEELTSQCPGNSREFHDE